MLENIDDVCYKEIANKYNATFATIKRPVQHTAVVCVHFYFYFLFYFFTFSLMPFILREPLDLLELDSGSLEKEWAKLHSMISGMWLMAKRN